MAYNVGSAQRGLFKLSRRSRGLNLHWSIATMYANIDDVLLELKH
jgi:hypothetical protein